ncbi:MAG: hypothetical protein FJW40_22915 [Acidobacteria bacterium]|nr:hypothetical protein [Acidobacteriota bacterium]
MDTYLAWLEQSAGARLAEVAPVVFVRAHLQWTGDRAELAAILASGLAMAARWIGAREVSREATGSAADGALNALVEFEQGQSALVSAEAVVGATEPQTQILIAGRHGTVRFDDYPDPGLLQRRRP